MQSLIKITTAFIALFLFISCGSDSVAPDPESSDIETVDIHPEATAFHTVTDPDIHATLAQVRRATAKYHDAGKAEEDGYGRKSSFVPKMGYHHVKVALIDNEVIPTQPEALVYVDNPVDSDKRRLIAVEYIIPEGLVEDQSDLDGKFPGVEGDTWHFEEGINAWTLHAWIWYPNPDGVFHANNSRVGDGS